MSTIEACAADPNKKVRHGFELDVDKSVGKAINVRFTYGEELKDQGPKTMGFPGGMTHRTEMRIPEEFEISWETMDGNKHTAKVPVRSLLPGSIEDKKVLFVIFQDHIEGYVSTYTPYGPKRERFY